MCALCFTSNKHLLQLYQTVTNLRFEVPVRSILCIPQKSLPHTIECVICVFEIGVDLVLVFVGFGLFQICSHLPFSPHSKDHTLHQLEKWHAPFGKAFILYTNELTSSLNLICVTVFQM